MTTIETFQAPAGGAVSPVNHQHYEGGQFMPVTGMSCGVKRAAAKVARVDGNFRLIEVVSDCYRKGVLVRYYVVGQERPRYMTTGSIAKSEALDMVARVLELRAAASRAAGLMPHPTAVTVEA